jgi:hypothetical protein
VRFGRAWLAVDADYLREIIPSWRDGVAPDAFWIRRL